MGAKSEQKGIQYIYNCMLEWNRYVSDDWYA